MSKLSETSSENLAARAASAPLILRSELSPKQRRILLRIAREAILRALEHNSFVESPTSSELSPDLSSELSPEQFSELSEPRGVFTTLYLHGDLPGERPRDPHSELHPEPHRKLRGCVGYALPIAPLHRAVAETACAAAFDDSRFSPVTREEAPRLEVSLSVLSHLFPIHPDTVEVGRHGLLISQGARRGLLLPQVPTEQNWDRKTFLQQTCQKAGLPLEAWRKDATIEAFTAEVFADSDVEVSG
jgi:AmmeMemoRadiSam system protein A